VILSSLGFIMFMQVSSERKSDTGKENVTKGEQFGRVSSKKGRKTASLTRPVSLK
jgi:chromosome transmission fidelity protein 18